MFESTRSAVIVLTMSLVGTVLAQTQPATTQISSARTLVFDPLHGHRIGSDGRSVIWTRETLDVKTVMNHVSAYEVQYFVQKLDSDKPADFIFAQRQSSGPSASATILNDGTFLLDANARLQWMPERPNRIGDPLYPPQEVGTFTLFPDGVISMPGGTRDDHLGASVQHVSSFIWWIPIVDRHLDVSSKVLLQKIDGLRGDNVYFGRHRNKIVWITAHPFMANAREPNAPPTLSLFDVSLKRVTTITLSNENVRLNSAIIGFDGSVAFDGNNAIDVSTGQVYASPHIASIGLLNGIIYSVNVASDACELVANPLKDVKTSHVLTRISKATIGSGSQPVDPEDLFFLTDDSVRAWDGKTWAALKVEK